MKSEETDRAKLVTRFCGEWVGSSAYLSLMAQCIAAGKDLELVYPDGKTYRTRVGHFMLATITGEPPAHDLLAPYSLETIADPGYRTLVGTLTEAEDREFYEAWSGESKAWMALVEAIVQAFPDLADEAYDALSAYFAARDFAVSFYHGELPDESGVTICEKAAPMEDLIALFLQHELPRREKAENVERLVVEL